ncbi:hydroxyacyl-thioester dehydratase HTD2 [Aspergillus stella-maris]|uniref:hydroxyacyl-thioester dehydratase HTD2 n=1 Tax=Aspergillus stella-maris TaxID=1810926 RepID=UPI003CCE075F
MLLTTSTPRGISRVTRLRLKITTTIPPLRFSSSTSASACASEIASSFLSRFQSLGPQTRTQTLDANQLRLLSLTLNRPSLFPSPSSPSLSSTSSASNTTPATEIPDGTPLPAGYHLVYFTPAFLENELGADGTDTSYNPAHPFTRRMWAGGEVRWPRDSRGRVNPLRVGQVVSETTRVLSAEAKVIRKTGEEMVVVGVEKSFGNGDGVAVVDRRNWVFRKALPPPSQTQSQIQTRNLPPPNPPSGTPATSTTTSSNDGKKHARTLSQTPVTLFRFSALTFNPHKIHYSLPWARDVEGHRDIVVHGPLNLINILDLWRDVRGEPQEEGELDLDKVLPERIVYRATSPIYAGDEYRVVLDESDGEGAGEDGKKSNVEIILAGGNVGMKAEVFGV